MTWFDQTVIQELTHRKIATHAAGFPMVKKLIKASPIPFNSSLFIHDEVIDDGAFFRGVDSVNATVGGLDDIRVGGRVARLVDKVANVRPCLAVVG